jgi:hypothetical protein
MAEKQMYSRLEINLYRSQINKELRKEHIGLFTNIRIPATDPTEGIYEGCKVDLAHKVIKIFYTKTDVSDHAKDIPQKIAVKGLEFTVEYVKGTP